MNKEVFYIILDMATVRMLFTTPSKRLHVDVLNNARLLRRRRREGAGSGSSLGGRSRRGSRSSLGRRSSSAGRRSSRLSRRRSGAAAGLGRRSRRRSRARATGADDRGGDVTALDVHAREVPVLGGAVVSETEHTKVPVGAVGVGGSGHRAGNLLEIVGAGGVVELDGAGAEVDAVGNVVPVTSNQLGVPLRLAANVPVEVVVGAALLAVLQLGEVALEEVDLVLALGGGGVGVGGLQGEVVEDLALVDGGAGLGDQLGAEHGLAVPRGGLIVGDLDALLGAGIGRVLGVGAEVDVVLGSTGAWSCISVMLVDNDACET
jgi:hypothetical protein